jgi:hypothetical protein
MNKYFNIKTCPLCQKPLYSKYISATETVYRCLQMAVGTMQLPADLGQSIKDSIVASTYETYKVEASHYEVSLDHTGFPSKYMQTSIFPPYCMISVAGTGRTKIFTWPQHSCIMEIPTLLPDRSPEEMVAKIKVLSLFS